MIPKECKRLAEVDFPIAVVSKHSAREKSIRHGHPSTLHLWWARRPLAACRAMLMALLLPDPCDPHCPAEFKTRARDIFKQSMLAGKPIKTDDDLRSRLLAFIGDFADWDNAGNAVYLEIGRGLVKAAHPEETPLVVDPFAGGGSIPLEALRLGCDAFASDLNPVACLINSVELEVFEPNKEDDVPAGTVRRAKATCPCCNAVLHADRVREQLRKQQGGADVKFDTQARRVGGAMMLAVVVLKDKEPGRHYRLPTGRDYQVVWKAIQRLKAVADEKLPSGLMAVPEERIPRTELRRISLPIYGVERFRDMFTSRQLLSLSELCRQVNIHSEQNRVINHLLTLCVGKVADLGNANSSWEPLAECPRHMLTRHDVPMSWDFAEAATWNDSSGSFSTVVSGTAGSIRAIRLDGLTAATTQQADACTHPLPAETAAVWFTDPPYYDAVPYAHLSDFFHIWQRRSLTRGATLPSLSPKDEECVVDRPHSKVPDAKTREQFEMRVGMAMREGCRVVRHDGIACVVFAHKTTEVWEALLGAMIQGGGVITASWPITTEMQSRLNARENASHASSVHLVCRPRSKEASIGDWSEVLRELPRRVAGWMDRLQAEHVRGADLVFACIGSALEIYSRHARVETAEGDPISLDAYLEKVWEVIGRVALKQILGTDAPNVYGEDVRLTALFLWTLRAADGNGGAKKERVKFDENLGLDEDDSDSEEEEVIHKRARGGYSLPYDIVRRFCQPLGIHIERWDSHLIDIHKGVVTLLPVESRVRRLLGPDTARDFKQVAKPESAQPTLFDELDDEIKTRKVRKEEARRRFDQATWSHLHQDTIPLLDHVHKAMLFQKQGHTNALRELLLFERTYRPDFLRLANALLALYPNGSEEKRSRPFSDDEKFMETGAAASG